MPLYKVKLSDGRMFKVKADEKPNESDILNALGGQESGQEDGLRTKARKDEFLPAGQRLSTGFRVNPEKFLEGERAERGLAPGTPLEPTPGTASFTENLKDLPLDVLDAVGGSIPVISQAIASAGTLFATKSPQAAMVTGAGAAGAGEAFRQFLGDVFLDPQDATISDRAKKVAIETGLGAASEVGGFALAKGFGAVKNQIAKGMEKARRGVVKTLNKVASRKGIDKALITTAQITRNLNREETLTLLKEVRTGNTDALSNKFASEGFTFRFADKILFGVGRQAEQLKNMTKNLYKMAQKNKSSAIRLGDVIGLDKDVVEQIIKKKGIVPKSILADDKFFFNTASKILTKSRAIRDTAGRGLVAEREEFIDAAIKSGGKTKIDDLLNTPLIGLDGAPTGEGSILEKLVRDGFLKRKEVVDGAGKKISGYVMGSRAQFTSVGSAQNRLIANIIDNFVPKKTVSVTDTKLADTIKQQISSIEKKLASESARKTADDLDVLVSKRRDLLKKLLAKPKANAKEIQIIDPNGSISTSRLVKNLNALQSQLSKREFEKIANLSPLVTQFKRALDSKVADLAESSGFGGIKDLTREFADISNSFRFFDDVIKGQGDTTNLVQLEGTLRSLAKESSQTLNEGMKIMQKRLGINILDDIKTYDAAKTISELDQIKSKGRIDAVMKGAFDNPQSREIMSEIDRALPKGDNMLRNAKIHIASLKLNRGLASFFRGQFIGRGLLGGVLGAQTLGPIGAPIGIAAGVGFQSPGVTKALIRGAAKAPVRQPIPNALRQEIKPGTFNLPDEQTRMALAALSRILQNNGEGQ